MTVAVVSRVSQIVGAVILYEVEDAVGVVATPV